MTDHLPENQQNQFPCYFQCVICENYVDQKYENCFHKLRHCSSEHRCHSKRKTGTISSHRANRTTVNKLQYPWVTTGPLGRGKSAPRDEFWARGSCSKTFSSDKKRKNGKKWVQYSFCLIPYHELCQSESVTNIVYMCDLCTNEIWNALHSLVHQQRTSRFVILCYTDLRSGALLAIGRIDRLKIYRHAVGIYSRSGTGTTPSFQQLADIGIEKRRGLRSQEVPSAVAALWTVESMERRWNARVGETGDPRGSGKREIPSVIVRNDHHMRKSGSDLAGNLIRFALLSSQEDEFTNGACALYHNAVTSSSATQPTTRDVTSLVARDSALARGRESSIKEAGMMPGCWLTRGGHIPPVPHSRPTAATVANRVNGDGFRCSSKDGKTSATGKRRSIALMFGRESGRTGRSKEARHLIRLRCSQKHAQSSRDSSISPVIEGAVADTAPPFLGDSVYEVRPPKSLKGGDVQTSSVLTKWPCDRPASVRIMPATHDWDDVRLHTDRLINSRAHIMEKKQDLSAFDRGQIVGTRRMERSKTEVVYKSLVFSPGQACTCWRSVSSPTIHKHPLAMGYRSRHPTRVPLPTACPKAQRLTWAREHRPWTQNAWKKIAWTVHEPSSLTGERYRNLLVYLRLQHPARDLHPQQDSATTNRSRIVTEWLEEHSTDLRLLAWPPSSPDLNPKERIWDTAGRELILAAQRTAVGSTSSEQWRPISLLSLSTNGRFLSAGARPLAETKLPPQINKRRHQNAVRFMPR
ncbi:hypothetical protein PR048_025059, partial [Dryococelus australis]